MRWENTQRYLSTQIYVDKDMCCYIQNILILYVCAVLSLFRQSCLTVRCYRRQPAGLRCPWDSPDKSTAWGCSALLQGTSVAQGSNPHPITPVLAAGLFTTSVAWGAPVFYIYMSVCVCVCILYVCIYICVYIHIHIHKCKLKEGTSVRSENLEQQERFSII